MNKSNMVYASIENGVKVRRSVKISLELYGCDFSQLEDVTYIMDVLIKTTRQAGMKVVGTKSHKFTPIGFTGVVLLAESHIAIHTYPEDERVEIDISACNPKNILRGYKYLVNSIHHTDMIVEKAEVIIKKLDEHNRLVNKRVEHLKLDCVFGS